MGEKKGLFARLFSGLSKTRGNLTEKVDEIARDDRKIDEDFYEELEDALLLADCGVKATTVIMDELRERVKLQSMKYASQAREALMDVITEQMDIPRPPLKWPMVMLMVGADSIRDVIAFPKVKDASCLMMEAPAPVDPKQLEDLDIAIVEKKEEE